MIFPSEVSTKLSVFDRFATYISAPHRLVFVVCVIIVVLWAPSFFLFCPGFDGDIQNPEG